MESTHAYFIISKDSKVMDELVDELNDGSEIISAVPVDGAVHYILKEKDFVL